MKHIQVSDPVHVLQQLSLFTLFNIGTIFGAIDIYSVRAYLADIHSVRAYLVALKPTAQQRLMHLHEPLFPLFQG